MDDRPVHSAYLQGFLEGIAKMTWRNRLLRTNQTSPGRMMVRARALAAPWLQIVLPAEAPRSLRCRRLETGGSSGGRWVFWGPCMCLAW